MRISETLQKLKRSVLPLALFLLTFNTFAQEPCENVILILQTGLWGEEMDFNVYDENDVEVFSLSNAIAESNGTIILYDNISYSFNLCIPSGCYFIHAMDSWGDGWNGGAVSIVYAGFMETVASLEYGEFGIFPFGVNAEGCAGPDVPGCMDPQAINYNPNANIDDGSCQYFEFIEGCTDPNATNYNPSATHDDGSCVYPELCEGVEAQLYICTFSNGEQIELEILDSEGNQVIYVDALGNVAIEYFELCLNPDECYTVNMYNNLTTGWYGGYYWINSGNGQLSTGELDDNLSEESATFSIGDTACPYGGCTDPQAFNFDENASFNDGSCLYPDECSTNIVYLSYTPGLWPEEVSWTLSDSEGQYVSSSQEYGSSTLPYEGFICLEDGCYTIAMFDSFGDGWNGAELYFSDQNNQLLGSASLIQGDFGLSFFGVNTDDCQPVIPGCTDPNALNYNPQASSDDGSCVYQEEIPGCTDPNASNYNWWATVDDGSCIYPEPCNLVSATLYVCTFSNGNQVELSISDSEGNEVIAVSDLGNVAIAYFDICLDPNECYTVTMSNNTGPFGWYGGYFWINGPGGQYAESGLVQGEESGQVSFSINGACEGLGCTDPEALNYNPEATTDNGSCVYPVFGCTDPTALNYNSLATDDDGSCEYPEPCDGTETVIVVNAGNWAYEMSWAILQDDEVLISGGNYLNYEVADTSVCLEDGCYTFEMYDSFGDGWNGGLAVVEVNATSYVFYLPSGSYGAYNFGVNTEDCFGWQPIYGCTDPEAWNYDAEATVDDGSCDYVDECWGNEVFFTIETGAIQEYINWGIGNQFGAYYATGSILTPFTTTTFSVCLEDACHTIYFYDEFGGWDDSFITASFNGEILFSNTGSNYEGIQFGVNADCGEVQIFGCTDPSATNYNPDATDEDGSCLYQPECDSNDLVFYLETQSFGHEISWSLENEEGVEVASGANFGSYMSYMTSLCLEDGCYSLSLMDSWGDGWNGAYFMILGNGQLYAEGTLLFGEYELQLVSVNGSCEVAGCTDPEAINYSPTATVDDGTCLYTIGISMNPAQLVGVPEELELNFYPNPFKSSVQWTVHNADPNHPIVIDVFDAIGKLVLSKNFSNNQEFRNDYMSFDQLENGVYFFNLRNGDRAKTTRLIKE